MMSSRIRSGHLTMWVEIRRHARRTLRAAAVLMCTAGAIPFWGFAQYPEKPDRIWLTDDEENLYHAGQRVFGFAFRGSA